MLALVLESLTLVCPLQGLGLGFFGVFRGLAEVTQGQLDIVELHSRHVGVQLVRLVSQGRVWLVRRQVNVCLQAHPKP